MLEVKSGKKIKKGDLICTWDPYNNAIISEEEGTVVFDMIEDGVTYREELDEQTGFREIVITETKDKKKNPAISHRGPKEGSPQSLLSACGRHVSVKEGDKVAQAASSRRFRVWRVSQVTSRVVCHG